MIRRWSFLFKSAAAGLALLVSGPVSCAEDETNGLVAVEVATVGIDPLTATPVLLLRELDGDGRFLLMSIGPAEAQAIGLAMFKVEMPRPMTHDLMKSLLEVADFELDRVVVDDFRGGTYFATIHGRRGKAREPVSVDSRPSDAIALAVRTMSPILVAERLLEGLMAPPDPQIDADQLFHVSGMTVVTASPDDLRRAGLEPDAGALRVVAVNDALKDLLKSGDLVIEADGRKMAHLRDLMTLLRDKRGAKSIQLLIRRNEEQLEVELPLTTEPLRRPAPGGQSPITA